LTPLINLSPIEVKNKYLKSLFMNNIFNDRVQIFGIAEGISARASQRTNTPQDGPLKEITLPPTSSDPRYETDHLQSTIGVFGEWERLPPGGVFLKPGDYVCKVVLTEESFHGSGGTLAGNWAAAMEGDISFTIGEVPPLPVPVLPMGTIAAFASMILGLTVTFALSMRKTRNKPTVNAARSTL
jgi:hypothetical protein